MNLASPLQSRRSTVLQALGITPWVRRHGPPAAGDMAPASAAVAGAASASCVVLMPAGCDTRSMDLLGRALNACGVDLARAGRISVADGQLSGPVPQAPVYLVFGQAQAHALGRELPAAVMSQAHIALADEPAQVLASAASKRRLWAALRQVRRALAVARSH